jgi:hypothetical protein
MADINAVAKQFTDFYYSTFDSNRATLAPLYVRRRFPHLRRRTSGSDLFDFLARYIYAHF